ncbi:hypothetical protein [Sphingomonas sp.]|uniref:hypothetical protein n=1 Tax=Sphingomonas sp. TaxID=28214 RepID=UPI003AFFDE26
MASTTAATSAECAILNVTPWTVEQLTGNLAAASLALNEGQMARLDEVSAPAPGFSAGLASPAIRRMVFGGRDVRGWGE